MSSSTKVKSIPAPDAETPAVDTSLPPQVQRFGQWVVYASIILGPLLYAPIGSSIYVPLETPRRLALFLCAWLLAALVLWSWSLRGRISWRRHPLDLPVGLYVLACVLTGLTSAYPYLSFFAPIWSGDGLLLTSIGILLYLGVKEFFRTDAEIMRATLVVVLTGGALALLGLGEYFLVHYCGRPELRMGIPALFGFNKNFSGLRVVSTIGNPMFTGLYFAMLIPAAVALAQAVENRLLRRWCYLAALVLLPALLLTQARAAWIGLFLTLPVLLAAVHAAFPRLLPSVPKKVWLIAGASLLLAILVGVSQPGIRQRLGSLANLAQGNDATVKTRMVYMQTSWRMFLAHPVQGWGTGNLPAIFPQYRPSSQVVEMTTPLNRGYSSSLPHNIFLQTAATMGILGLIPLVWLLVLVYRGGFALLRAEPHRAWLVIALLGILTANLFTNQFCFDNGTTMALFWTALGLLAAITAEERPAAQALTPMGTSVLRVAALAVAVLAGLHTLAEVGAAVLTERGTRGITAAVTQNNLGMLKATIQELKLSLPLTLSIGRHGLQTGDVVSYEGLCIANKNYINMAQDRESFEKANAECVAAAKNALARDGRAPRALRFLAMVYTQQGNLDAAIDTANWLCYCEPNSSEACLIASDSYIARGSARAGEGAYEEATADMQKAEYLAQKAVDLDPTYAPAWAKLAFVQSTELSELGEPSDATRLINSGCANYRKAIALQLDMNLDDRLRFAMILFLRDLTDGKGGGADWQEGITVGRELREAVGRQQRAGMLARGDNPFMDLLSNLKLIYKHKPELWKKTLDQIQNAPEAPAPPPVKVPAATPWLPTTGPAQP
jgi:O-antigen ligase/tetratricopeptide (TPR) repeat protein